VPSSVLEGRLLSEINLKPAGRVNAIIERFRECAEKGESLQFRNYAPVQTAKGMRWVYYMMNPIMANEARSKRVMSTISDVTDLKLTEERLSKALTQVLSGYIPICAACKKIRKEDGDNWEAVEGYIQNHSEAEFSHTMCPKCMHE